jgi:hypothetical protein
VRPRSSEVADVLETLEPIAGSDNRGPAALNLSNKKIHEKGKRTVRNGSPFHSQENGEIS